MRRTIAIRDGDGVRHTFREVSEDRYIEMLEILWPALWISIGFLVGETFDHDDNGNPRFTPFVKIGSQHYEGLGPMTIKQFRGLVLGSVEVVA